MPRTRRARSRTPTPPPEASRSWSARDALAALLLVVLVLAIYAPVRHYDFVQLDDPVQVTENPAVTGGLTWSNVEWAFTATRAGYWMPLIWISHMTDVQIYGLDAGGHHVTNVALHAVNTVLLFLLLVTLTGARGPSLCVAALFAAHPLHVESVAWITERKDVLSTVFWMLTLWAYAAYARQPTRARHAVVIGVFAIGLLTKPMLVTLPIVMLLLDVWPLGRVAAPATGSTAARRWWPLLREKIPLVVLSAAASVVALYAQAGAGAVASLSTSPLSARLANVLVSYVSYLGKAAWPADLSAYYGLPASIPAWQVVGSFAILAGLSFWAWRQVRRRPYVTVGWFWYLVTLLPVIGIVQIGVQGMADRFTYVPLIGIFIAVVWTLDAAMAPTASASRALQVVAVVCVGTCAVLARQQLRYWQDNVSLFTRMTVMTLGVDEYHAHLQLGATLRDSGRLDEAARHFEDAIALDANSAEAHTGLALLLAGEGRIAEALPHFAEAARLRPELAMTHVNFGTALVKAGRRDDAVRQFDEALRIDPANQTVRAARDEILRLGKEPDG